MLLFKKIRVYNLFMTAQKQFLQELKRNLPLEVIHVLSPKITGPHPIVHYCHSGHPGWIELVVSDTFPNRLNLTQGEVSWHDQYWNAGGNCYIFLKVASKNIIYIWPGKFAKDLVREDGCIDTKPMLEARMHEKGWQELYEIFNLDEFELSVV